MQIQTGEGAAELLHGTPQGKRAKVERGQARRLDKIDHQLIGGAVVSRDEKHGLGLCGEKSCIQAIGILLIDFTSLAPGAISATISLDVRPSNAATDLVTAAALVSGFASIWALVPSTRMRPCQSTPSSAFGTSSQFVARIVMSNATAPSLESALANGPRPATSSASASGPRELDRTTSWPAPIK